MCVSTPDAESMNPSTCNHDQSSICVPESIKGEFSDIDQCIIPWFILKVIQRKECTVKSCFPVEIPLQEDYSPFYKDEFIFHENVATPSSSRIISTDTVRAIVFANFSLDLDPTDLPFKFIDVTWCFYHKEKFFSKHCSCASTRDEDGNVIVKIDESCKCIKIGLVHNLHDLLSATVLPELEHQLNQRLLYSDILHNPKQDFPWFPNTLHYHVLFNLKPSDLVRRQYPSADPQTPVWVDFSRVYIRSSSQYSPFRPHVEKLYLEENPMFTFCNGLSHGKHCLYDALSSPAKSFHPLSILSVDKNVKLSLAQLDLWFQRKCKQETMASLRAFLMGTHSRQSKKRKIDEMATPCTTVATRSVPDSSVGSLPEKVLRMITGHVFEDLAMTNNYFSHRNNEDPFVPVIHSKDMDMFSLDPEVQRAAFRKTRESLRFRV